MTKRCFGVISPNAMCGRLWFNHAAWRIVVLLQPQVLRQPSMAYCPVEVFHIGILLRVAGLDIIQSELSMTWRSRVVVRPDYSDDQVLTPR